MTRQRLRPAWTEDELSKIYVEPHDHKRFPDHRVRVEVTIQLGRWFAQNGAGSAADLSCGNGYILKNLPAERKIYGDYAPGYPITGPIEQTINRIPRVGLYVCCETLEHLDDPDAVLRAIRGKAKGLLLSTPVDNFGDDNSEHYWAWSQNDVEDMLRGAGFKPLIYNLLDLRPIGCMYAYGIWCCE